MECLVEMSLGCSFSHGYSSRSLAFYCFYFGEFDVLQTRRADDVTQRVPSEAEQKWLRLYSIFLSSDSVISAAAREASSVTLTGSVELRGTRNVACKWQTFYRICALFELDFSCPAILFGFYFLSNKHLRLVSREEPEAV